MSHIITVYIKLKTMSFILLNLEFKIVICRWKLLIFCLAVVSIKRVGAVHMQADLKVFRSRTSFSSFSQTTLCIQVEVTPLMVLLNKRLFFSGALSYACSCLSFKKNFDAPVLYINKSVKFRVHLGGQ